MERDLVWSDDDIRAALKNLDAVSVELNAASVKSERDDLYEKLQAALTCLEATPGETADG